MAASTGEHFPRQAEAITPTFDAMEAMDISVRAYLDACWAYASHPNTKNGSVLDGLASCHADASRTYLLALAEGMTVGDFEKTATRFLMDKDAERVENLNGLLGGDKLLKRDEVPRVEVEPDEPIDDDTLKRIIGASIAEIHRMGVATDTEIFVNIIDESPAARRLERREKLRGHALGIGEAALGGALGTALVLWAARRRA